MKTKKYDEFQQEKRRKIGFQSFVLLLGLVWINGAIKELYGIWAEPLIEAQVLMLIACLYFLNTTILKNAYFRLNERSKGIFFILGFSALFSAILFILLPWTELLYIDEMGQLTGTVFPAMFSMICITAFISMLVRRLLDRRMEA